MNNLDLLGFARKKKKRNYLKIVYGLLFSGAVSIVLAGQIGLNLGNVIEFGQGAARTSVCDSDINIEPKVELMRFNSDPYNWPDSFIESDFDVARPYFLAYINEIGRAVSTDAQWAEYEQAPDDQILIERATYPNFYLSELIIRDLNFEDCDGKLIKIVAQGPNSQVGPISFLNNNSLGKILAPDEPIVEFVIDTNSPFGNLTQLEPPHTFSGHYESNWTIKSPNPWITAVNADEPNPELWISFKDGPRYLTQSIKKFVILTFDDSRAEGLESAAVGDIKAVSTGGFVKIRNYDPQNNYSIYPFGWHIGDGVFYISSPYDEFNGEPVPAEESYTVGVLVSRDSYKSKSTTFTTSVFPLSTFDPNTVALNLGYARTGFFNRNLCPENWRWPCEDGLKPRVNLFFEIVNAPEEFVVKQICRSTNNILLTDLANATGFNQRNLLPYEGTVFRDLNIETIRPSCTIGADSQYYYRLGVYNTGGDLLAASNEITVPQIQDNTEKLDLLNLKMFIPN